MKYFRCNYAEYLSIVISFRLIYMYNIEIFCKNLSVYAIHSFINNFLSSFFKLIVLFHQPQFAELEQSFKQKTNDFEEMKKYIVGKFILPLFFVCFVCFLSTNVMVFIIYVTIETSFTFLIIQLLPK